MVNPASYRKAIVAAGAAVVGVVALFGVDVSKEVEKAGEVLLVLTPFLVYIFKND